MGEILTTYHKGKGLVNKFDISGFIDVSNLENSDRNTSNKSRI